MKECIYSCALTNSKQVKLIIYNFVRLATIIDDNRPNLQYFNYYRDDNSHHGHSRSDGDGASFHGWLHCRTQVST